MDRKLKIANCDALLEQQLVEMAKKYKSLTFQIDAMAAKIKNLESQMERAVGNEQLKATLEKTANVYKTTLASLENAKTKLSEKISSRSSRRRSSQRRSSFLRACRRSAACPATPSKALTTSTSTK